MEIRAFGNQELSRSNRFDLKVNDADELNCSNEITFNNNIDSHSNSLASICIAAAVVVVVQLSTTKTEHDAIVMKNKTH